MAIAACQLNMTTVRYKLTVNKIILRQNAIMDQSELSILESRIISHIIHILSV